MADSSEVVYQTPNFMRPPETWTLTLNRYQRDNLLRLLQDVMEGHQRPVGRHNTGDWVGEIRWMLGKEFFADGKMQHSAAIDGNDRPNPIFDAPDSDDD